ncbi:Nn.00g066250.m01.CDS01 [Neocucurbitaria sp. VM-36]
MEEIYATIPDRDASPEPSLDDAHKSPSNLYEALPTTTSIRLLEVSGSQPDDISCRIHIVDLEDEPEFAALSYTWGNPATVYDEPMPDTSHIQFPKNVDQFPFVHTTGPLGPHGETMASVDHVKRDYLSIYPRIPYEKVAWKSGITHQIIVNNHAVEVEENLFEYLKWVISMRFRYSEKGGSSDQLYDYPRLLMWIDALCINQMDLSERAAQVQLMARIYKSAKIILAWVGQQDDLCNLAFTSISNILAWESEHMDDVFGDENNNKPRRRDQDHVTLSSVPDMTIVHWFALFALFQRLWFRRAWIAQEAIFSKDLLIICGGNLIGFNLLLTVFTILEDNGLDYELCRVGRNLLIGQSVATPILQLENFGALSRTSGQATPAVHLSQLSVVPWDVYSFVLGYHRVRGCLGLSEVGRPLLWNVKSEGKDPSGHGLYSVDIPMEVKLKDTIMEEVEPGVFKFHKRPLRLLSILSDFRNLSATDPRDKIFAFLNLATDNLGIIPDYHASVENVFLGATKQMLIQYGSLAVLSHCQDPADTKISGLPGWVPDFSVRLGHTPFDTGGEVLDFSASYYPTNSHFEFCSDGTLAVEGIRVDTVSATTDFEGDAVVKILTLLLHVPAIYPVIPFEWRVKEGPDNRRRRQLDPRFTRRIEALWRTLIADALTEVDVCPDELNSRDGFGSGFRTWIIADILEARSILILFSDSYQEDWAGQLVQDSFRTRLALWLAVYERRYIPGGSNLDMPSFGDVLDLYTEKRVEEKDQYQLDQHLGVRHPTIGLEHFPTATQIDECFGKNIHKSREKEKEQEISLGDSYRNDTLGRFTSLQRRQLRNFEKHMRKATEGRRLISSSSGLIGLAPMSTAQDKTCRDEIWLLRGARVPFILRRLSENRYRIVGEAYVHGLMYGEAVDSFHAEEFWTGLHGDMFGIFPDFQKIHLV